MICPDCHGCGWNRTLGWPCDCGGSGIIHCCEGHSAMNEPDIKPDIHPRIAAHQRWMETQSRFAHACPDLDQEYE